MDALKPIIVLLVEDNAGWQKLIKEVLMEQEPVQSLHITGSGEQALEYLERSKTDSSSNPRPNLILLDLNMPGMGGKEFLRRVKKDNVLCSIPVVILTMSDLEVDIQDSYNLNVVKYLQKPRNLKGLQKIIKEIIEYWFIVFK